MNNLFDDVPGDLPAELLQSVFAAKQFRLERIVSRGHSSPEGFWYDQEEHEWVLLLQGSAALRFEDGEHVELRAGSFLHIPARRRHRVEWTEPDQPTIWLAIHYGA